MIPALKEPIMSRKQKILAIIPARGGSKGIPNKNIKLLGGKPLIVWTIQAAQQAKIFDLILVSTDSAQIAQTAKTAGAVIPFLRPRYLSTDTAKTMDAVLHAIEWLERESKYFDLVMVLQPTSPLRTAKDIQQALKLFKRKKAESVISVTKTEHHPRWANTLQADGNMKNFMTADIFAKNRQQLPIYYRLNGAIYLADVKILRNKKNLWNNKTYAYIMPSERSVDIDQILDFQLTELLLKHSARKSHI